MEENKDYIVHKVQAGYNYTVFKNENNGRAYYKIGIEQKQFDGQKIRGYMPVKFKKGVELEDKTRIKIKQGVENFYFKAEDTRHYNPIFYIQINDFEIIDNKIEEYNQDISGEDDDLPF